MTTVLAPARTPRAPRYLTISAWAVPIMVLGQFAFLAMIPVALVLYGALRNPHARDLRWPAALLTAAFATPLTIWLLRPDGAQSLSKDIHPVFVGLIVAASAVVLLKLWTHRR